MVQHLNGKSNHITSLENLRQLCCKYTESWKIAEEFYKNLISENRKINFSSLIISDLSDEDFIMTIKLMTNLSDYTADFRKHEIFHYCLTNNFFDRLVKFLNKFYINKSTNKKYLITILSFHEAIIIYLPICDITYEKTRSVLLMVRECFKIIEYKDTEVFDKIDDILDILDDKDYLIGRNKFHYTGLDVFPSIVDLFEKRILVSNKVKGPYQNSEQYLDINFKLIKEDFIGAIREGFESYRSKSQDVKVKSSSDFEFYRNVKCDAISLRSGCKPASHVIEFSSADGAALSKCNWEESKKFMNGSIVFFSRNDFKTFFAGIIQLNLLAISFGKTKALHVSIIGNPLKLKLKTTYDMAEPRYFFGQYYYTMKMLQRINPYSFPMADHIISISDKEIPSSLISKSPFYNPSTRMFCYKGDDLNESQKKALNTALSQNFTLIQGPPGTGKSHVARKIIEILASDVSDERPVLVVCMRNKALDIILEPLVELGIDVIRLGRTDSEILEKFTLFNYKERWGKNKGACSKLLTKKLTLYKKVIKNCKTTNGSRQKDIYKRHNDTCEAFRLHSDYFDGTNIIARKIKVIGATIYGAAKRNAMLSQINPKAVIIEEAAEILESFLVSSIPLTCDHLILIGDHLQLQPITSSHQSVSKYNLNISFFERMVINGKKFCQLNVQHRMRPEIAELICPFIYKDILNHPSVTEFDDVVGVSKNVFFISHSENEDLKGQSKSISNSYEAGFVVSLANYLVLQGYRPNEISILAAYSAQQQLIIQKARNYPLLSNTDIQSIDNYQGDENNIILLSLVRSNGTTVGFLAKSNRINVALSRAKKGLFIVGNMVTLAKHSTLWKEINGHLTRKKCIGAKLPLKCKSHGRITKVSTPGEIDSLTNGGCKMKCGFKLTCGHVCSSLCHPYSEFHANYCKTCFRHSLNHK